MKLNKNFNIKFPLSLSVCFFIFKVKVKLGSILSSVWLATILIEALPIVYCLESGNQKIGTVKSHQLSEILSEWT